MRRIVTLVTLLHGRLYRPRRYSGQAARGLRLAVSGVRADGRRGAVGQGEAVGQARLRGGAWLR